MMETIRKHLKECRRLFLASITWNREVSLSGVWKRVAQTMWHFVSRGALLGINSRLDPEVRPSILCVALTILGLLAAVLCTSGAVRCAVLLILCSPIWLYVFARVHDVVLEYRGYISLIGIALLAAAAADRTPGLVAILAILFAVRTSQRIRDYKTKLSFWTAAHRECPRKPRPWLNYAEALHTENRTDEAIAEYEQIVPMKDRCAGTAAANLGLLYLQKSTRAANDQERQEWILKAADVLDEGMERFPDHDVLSNNRGAFFMGLKRFEDAIQELTIALYRNPMNSAALRNRGKCYAILSRTDESEADYAAAFKIDGRHVDPFLIRGPRPKVVA